MKILFIFATAGEADILKSISGEYPGKSHFESDGAEIQAIITGVGGMSTAWGMQQWLRSNQKPDLAINAGIAGSYSEKFEPGDVVMPVMDCFADLGIEKEGRYLTLAEAGFMNPDEYPFRNGFIHSDNEYVSRLSPYLPAVKAITVNTASGTSGSIEKLRNKFNPDIETMEGATFFYICARENIPFLAIRAISNLVEPRGNTGWDIPLALKNLAGKLKEILIIVKKR